MSIRAPKVNEEIDVKFLMSEDDDGNEVWEWYTGKVTKIAPSKVLDIALEYTVHFERDNKTHTYNLISQQLEQMDKTNAHKWAIPIWAKGKTKAERPKESDEAAGDTLPNKRVRKN